MSTSEKQLVKALRRMILPPGYNSNLLEGAAACIEHLQERAQRLSEERDDLLHQNHNLNWALGTEGYTQMATPEEQAEHEEGMERIKEQIARLSSSKAQWDALLEVRAAARAYFDGYMQDEAEDDAEDWVGCTLDQHQKAKRVRLALEYSEALTKAE